MRTLLATDLDSSFTDNVAALRWGKDNEAHAVDFYINMRRQQGDILEVDHRGLTISLEYPWLCGSSDGIVTELRSAAAATVDDEDVTEQSAEHSLPNNSDDYYTTERSANGNNRNQTSRQPSCGILEIKCPHSKRFMTVEQACADQKFCCELAQDGSVRLKRSHNYYYQVRA